MLEKRTSFYTEGRRAGYRGARRGKVKVGGGFDEDSGAPGEEWRRGKVGSCGGEGGGWGHFEDSEVVGRRSLFVSREEHGWCSSLEVDVEEL